MYGLQTTRLRHFNPRSPWGERRKVIVFTFQFKIFQSTLPVGGATYGSDLLEPEKEISIHAPRGGSDDTGQCASLYQGISIHAPRGGSDIPVLSVRKVITDFNPRSPWGERQQRCTVLPAYLWRKGKF